MEVDRASVSGSARSPQSPNKNSGPVLRNEPKFMRSGFRWPICGAQVSRQVTECSILQIEAKLTTEDQVYFIDLTACYVTTFVLLSR